MKLNLPSKVTTALGCVAGLLAVANQVVFGDGSAWATYITVALIFLGGLGVSPLVGAAFRSALHLSPRASVITSAALAALAVAVASITMPDAVHAVLEAVLAFGSALGFAPVAPEVTKK